MKKMLVFLLSFLYIASSCEATVYLHYCMGKQVGFSLFPRESGNCPRCGMQKAGKGMGCCKDEQKIIKSDKSQKLTDLSYAKTQFKKFFTLISVYRVYTVPSLKSTLILHSPAHGPPPGEHPVPVYLMNSLLLI